MPSSASTAVGIGIDIGGSSVKAGAVVVGDTRVTFRAERRTGGGFGGDASLRQVLATVDEVHSQVRAFNSTVPAGQHLRIVSYGVGSPGPLGENGSYVVAPALGWDRYPLRTRLIEGLSRSPREGNPGPMVDSGADIDRILTIENDANVAAFGCWVSMGKTDKSLFLCTLSTGLGAGLVLPGGEVFRGDSGNAVELGHFPIGDRDCDYDHGPCLVGSIAGWALERRFGFRPEEAPYEVRAQVAKELGRGLSAAVHAYDVRSIVMMGSVALGFERTDREHNIPPDRTFLALVRQSLRAHSLTHAKDAVVVPTPLGADTGVFGAAMLGLKEVGLLHEFSSSRSTGLVLP